MLKMMPRAMTCDELDALCDQICDHVRGYGDTAGLLACSIVYAKKLARSAQERDLAEAVDQFVQTYLQQTIRKGLH